MSEDAGAPLKRLPPGSAQHSTAGPYSPVLEVRADRLVVISGQVSVNSRGEVVGTTIEEQTNVTLDNCLRQLRAAGCGFDEVFKANIYLADIADWPRFNTVYANRMPAPLPVRTAVQAVLLPGFRVEIEMWAAKGGG